MFHWKSSIHPTWISSAAMSLCTWFWSIARGLLQHFGSRWMHESIPSMTFPIRILVPMSGSWKVRFGSFDSACFSLLCIQDIIVLAPFVQIWIMELYLSKNVEQSNVYLLLKKLREGFLPLVQCKCNFSVMTKHLSWEQHSGSPCQPKKFQKDLQICLHFIFIIDLPSLQEAVQTWSASATIFWHLD